MRSFSFPPNFHSFNLFLLSVKSFLRVDSHDDLISNRPCFCLLTLIKIRPILSPYEMRSTLGPGMAQHAQHFLSSVIVTKASTPDKQEWFTKCCTWSGRYSSKPNKTLVLMLNYSELVNIHIASNSKQALYKFTVNTCGLINHRTGHLITRTQFCDPINLSISHVVTHSKDIQSDPVQRNHKKTFGGL